MSGQVCIWCGGTFEGRRRLYCDANCRRRAWDREKYRTACVQCGADIDAHHQRCRACENAERHAQREDRLALIAELYNAGVPLREMAARFGRSSKSSPLGPELDELRKRGLIGYRRIGWAERKAAA